MKGFLYSLLIVCLVSSAWARGFSSGGRSYSGGGYSSRGYSYSRPSYSAPRSYYRTPPIIQHNSTTVIHSGGYGGGGGDGGFFSGMFGGMLGASMMNHSQPVIVQQPVISGQPAQAVDQGQQVITEQSNSSTFWTFVLILLVLFIGIPLIVYLARREAR